MDEIFNYTFDTDLPEDGIVNFNDKKCVKLLNFGCWPYNTSPAYGYSKGRCALWNNNLAAALASSDNFRKCNIDKDCNYILKICLKTIKNLGDSVYVGFFRASNDFNTLNDGPHKGKGPFTALGNPNRIRDDVLISTVDFPCETVSDDFTEVTVTVSGYKILDSMLENDETDKVYVGVMNFAHRDEPEDCYIAIDSITVQKEKTYIFINNIALSEHTTPSGKIGIKVSVSHANIDSKILYNGEIFIVKNALCNLCDNLGVQMKTVGGIENTYFYINEFDEAAFSTEITFTPILIGENSDGEKKAIFGDTVSFSVLSVYKRMLFHSKSVSPAVLKKLVISKPEKLQLYNDNPVNDDFLGFSAIYYPWIYQRDPDERNYTEEQAKEELDRLKESGIKIVRLTVFASYDWYDEENNSWHFDDEKFYAQLRSLKEIQIRDIDMVINVEWGTAIQTSCHVFGDNRFYKFPFEKECELFGDFVYEFLKVLRENGISRAKYISFFSEPNNEKAAVFDGNKDSKYREKKSISAVHKKLKKEGIRDDYKFIMGQTAIGDDIWNYTWQLIKPTYDAVNEYADIWAYHTYNRATTEYGNTASNFERILGAVNESIEDKLGLSAKNVWFDEYNALEYGTDNSSIQRDELRIRYPLNLVSGMIALLNTGYKTVINWTFVDTLWIGSHNGKNNHIDGWHDGVHCHGLMPNLMQSKIPYRSYYAYTLFSKFIKDGKIFRGENSEEKEMCCTAALNNDGSMAIAVINSGLLGRSFILNFNKELEQKTFYRHLFVCTEDYKDESATIISSDKVLKNVTNVLKDTLPAGSVAVYTTEK